jgi:hypothetical protein
MKMIEQRGPGLGQYLRTRVRTEWEDFQKRGKSFYNGVMRVAMTKLRSARKCTPSSRYSGERAGERGEAFSTTGCSQQSMTFNPSPQPSPRSTGEREKERYCAIAVTITMYIIPFPGLASSKLLPSVRLVSFLALFLNRRSFESPMVSFSPVSVKSLVSHFGGATLSSWAS